MKSVDIDPNSTEAVESWLGLMDLADELPDEWSVAGGQMVFLHAVERGAEVIRPSDDADLVIDVRAHPGASEHVFASLRAIGFESAGFNLNGIRHKWIRGEAEIDVLQPRHLGERLERAL